MTGKKPADFESSRPTSPPSFKKFKATFRNPKICESCLQFNTGKETVCKNCGNMLGVAENDSEEDDIQVIDVFKNGDIDLKKSESLASVPRNSSADSSQLNRNNFARITSFTLSASKSPASTFFWEGKVTMTFTQTSKSTFRFSHLFNQPGCILKQGIFASFCLDVEWMSQFLPSMTPISFITGRPKDGSVPDHVKHIQINPFVKMIFPHMPSLYGCMHIKFLILMYQKHVRVVIPSANLVPHDWDSVENIVYFQDFPLMDVSKSDQNDIFKIKLSKLLTDLRVSHQTIEELKLFDFTSALGDLIISKPGYKTNATGSYGQAALSKAVSRLSLNVKSGQRPSIYCQSSSLGSLNQKWLNEFISSISGKSKEERVDAKFHLCFPSLSTVKESIDGVLGGGTIFCQRKYWEQKGFPKNNVYDCKSLSPGSLMHSKIILYSLHSIPPSLHISLIHPSSNLDKDGYIYLGSHNHTKAAWGWFQANNDRLNMNNWELGVIIPFWFVKDHAPGSDFTIPFQIPPPTYKKDDIPWIMSEHL